jgi:hypothetical protein
VCIELVKPWVDAVVLAVFSGSVSSGKDRPACVIGWEVEESAPSSGAGFVMSRVASVTNVNRGATDSMLTYVSSGLKNSLHRLSLIAGTIFEVWPCENVCSINCRNPSADTLCFVTSLTSLCQQRLVKTLGWWYPPHISRTIT